MSETKYFKVYRTIEQTFVVKVDPAILFDGEDPEDVACELAAEHPLGCCVVLFEEDCEDQCVEPYTPSESVLKLFQ